MVLVVRPYSFASSSVLAPSFSASHCQFQGHHRFRRQHQRACLQVAVPPSVVEAEYHLLVFHVATRDSSDVVPVPPLQHHQAVDEGLSDQWCKWQFHDQLVFVGIRSAKVIAKAFRAGFHLVAHRV